MADISQFPLNPSEKTLVTTSLEIGRFALDWSHCDQLSNFLARSVSLDRPDPFFFANLLSTILNEVFESIFHYHAEEGRITLSLRETGAETILDAFIPVNATASDFYLQVARDLNANQPDELFRSHLLSSADDRAIGFFELAAVYQARIQIEPAPERDVIHLLIRVRIDEAPQSVAA